MKLGEGALQHLGVGPYEPELAFLRAGLRNYFGLSPDEVPTARALSPRRIFEISRLNKIAGFLSVGSPAAEQGGSNQLGALLSAYRRRMIEVNSLAMRNTLVVHRALEEAGVDFLFMKGPVQQKLLYGAFFMKPSGDVDVVVAPSDFGAAREALARIGFHPADGSRSLWWTRFLGEQHLVRHAPGPSTVDLHNRLQQPGSPSPRHPAAFLRRKRQVDFAGSMIPFLGAADVVLLASISIAKAFYNREPCAGYLCDLQAGIAAMPEGERRQMLLDAEEQGLRDTLLFAVRAADVVIGEGLGALSEEAAHILPETGDQDLRNIMLVPWFSAIAWPKRREMLWALCGEKPVRYFSEAGWAVSAEISRRLFDRAQGARGI
jgi:hypothetical protein